MAQGEGTANEVYTSLPYQGVYALISSIATGGRCSKYCRHRNAPLQAALHLPFEPFWAVSWLLLALINVIIVARLNNTLSRYALCIFVICSL